MRREVRRLRLVPGRIYLAPGNTAYALQGWAAAEDFAAETAPE
jgi:hypothetical protein